MPKRKKKNIFHPPCGICQTFEEIPSKHRLANSRYCHTSGKRTEIDYDHPSCKKFVMAEYFWCEHIQRRINKTVCFHRFKNIVNFKDFNGCKKCPIGKMLESDGSIYISPLIKRQGRKSHV
jgi:hypothetical protein